MSASDRQAIEQKAKALKELTASSDDVAKIRQAGDELTQATHKLAEEVYKNAQGAGGAGQGAGVREERPQSPEESAEPSGKDDNVVDAEFKVKDDKK